MRKSLSITVLVLLFSPLAFGDEKPEKTTLSCNHATVVLAPEQQKAILVGKTSSIEGSLEQTDYFYLLKFPSTRMSSLTQNEIRLKINRYTGDYRWEFGEALIDPQPDKDWFQLRDLQIGQCLKAD